MNYYTPINIHQLSKKGREVLSKIDDIIFYSSRISKVFLNPHEFELLKEGLGEHQKRDCDSIPYKGKIIVPVRKA